MIYLKPHKMYHYLSTTKYHVLTSEEHEPEQLSFCTLFLELVSKMVGCIFYLYPQHPEGKQTSLRSKMYRYLSSIHNFTPDL